MINPKQVVPAIVAVTLLSLAPAAEALAIEEHAQATKPTAAAGKPAAAKPAEAKADAPKDAKADAKTQAPASADPAKETPPPSVEQAQKAYDNGSYEEAFIIVEPLAKLEHPDAEYLLGLMYELGHGVKKDTEQAAALFTSAANQGYAAAQAKLGQLHMEGKKDYASAMSWFQKAADQGYALAYSAIGDLYAMATAWAKIRVRRSATMRKPLTPAMPTLVCTSAKCTNKVRTLRPIRYRPPSGTRRARISAAPNVPPP